MKRILLKSCLILSCSILLIACKKDDPAPEDTTPTTPGVNKGDFSWTAGASTVAADSAYFYSQFTTVFAFKNGTSNSIEINLSALSAGSYSLSSATGNALTFVTGATTYTANTGSCNITASANNKLSGNFSATLHGGTLTAISGTFSNILQK